MRVRNYDYARTFGLHFTTTHSDYGHAGWQWQTSHHDCLNHISVTQMINRLNESSSELKDVSNVGALPEERTHVEFETSR